MRNIFLSLEEKIGFKDFNVPKTLGSINGKLEFHFDLNLSSMPHYLFTFGNSLL